MGGGTDPIALPAGPGAGKIPVPATLGPSLNLKPVAGIPLKGVRLIEMAWVQGSKPQRCALCDICMHAVFTMYIDVANWIRTKSDT